jgi:methionyl-tRNA formyltransferase
MGVRRRGGNDASRRARPDRLRAMPARLLLLTGACEAAALGPVVAKSNPACRVVPVTSEEALADADDGTPGTRLVAFCSSVIVPGAMLARLDRGAYNIHPGPPGYPGRYPACWGSYDGVRRFGATLHRMAARVDAGPIVAVDWFDVPAEVAHTALSDRVLAAAIALFVRFAPALAGESDLPIDPDLTWSGRKTRLSDYEAICRLPPDIDARELERRRRAFADQPGACLALELHGRRFVWQAPPETTAPSSRLAVATGAR